MAFNAHLSDDVLLADVRPRFSSRVDRRLEELGFKTVGEVRRTTDRQLLSGAINFGRKSLNELRMEFGPYVPPDEHDGNGRDEGAYAVQEALEAADDLVRPPLVTPKHTPTFPNLFIHTVENGYIIRPAYPQGDRLASTDVRTWIVPTREALAALVVELMAVPRLEQGTPQQLPQPGMFYSPPIIMETAAGA